MSVVDEARRNTINDGGVKHYCSDNSAKSQQVKNDCMLKCYSFNHNKQFQNAKKRKNGIIGALLEENIQINRMCRKWNPDDKQPSFIMFIKASLPHMGMSSVFSYIEKKWTCGELLHIRFSDPSIQYNEDQKYSGKYYDDLLELYDSIKKGHADNIVDKIKQLMVSYANDEQASLILMDDLDGALLQIARFNAEKNIRPIYELRKAWLRAIVEINCDRDNHIICVASVTSWLNEICDVDKNNVYYIKDLRVFMRDCVLNLPELYVGHSRVFEDAFFKIAFDSWDKNSIDIGEMSFSCGDVDGKKCRFCICAQSDDVEQDVKEKLKTFVTCCDFNSSFITEPLEFTLYGGTSCRTTSSSDNIDGRVKDYFTLRNDEDKKRDQHILADFLNPLVFCLGNLFQGGLNYRDVIKLKEELISAVESYLIDICKKIGNRLEKRSSLDSFWFSELDAHTFSKHLKNRLAKFCNSYKNVDRKALVQAVVDCLSYTDAIFKKQGESGLYVHPFLVYLYSDAKLFKKFDEPERKEQR